MFSNDRKPMKIDPEDRRLFVITIDKKKFEVRKKLESDSMLQLLQELINFDESFNILICFDPIFVRSIIWS